MLGVQPATVRVSNAELDSLDTETAEGQSLSGAATGPGVEQTVQVLPSNRVIDRVLSAIRVRKNHYSSTDCLLE